MKLINMNMVNLNLIRMKSAMISIRRLFIKSKMKTESYFQLSHT